MARDLAAAEALHRHVFGTPGPSGSLVNFGRLPPGWAEEYRRLLRATEAEWGDEPLWPRRLAGAIYFVVTHLEVRYQAWRAMEGGRRDEATERELVWVSAPSRIFLARGFADPVDDDAKV